MGSAPPSPEVAKLVEAGSLCACFNLRKAARAVTSMYDEALRPTGLRATQLPLLLITRVLGTATGGWSPNDANSLSVVPNSWIVQPADALL